MRVKTLASTIFVAILFLIACNRNAVSLSYTNAKEEVPQLGNLTFRFSQSMVKDSMLNVWDSTEFISFDPAIPGRFRWEGPDQLVFSPSQPLLPATNYSAKVKSAVLKFSKYDKVQGGDDIKFHTPKLNLDNSLVTWMLQDEGSRVAVPQLDLFFNYRINPADLKDKLVIEVEGSKVDYTPLTVSPDNKISVRINGLKQEDKDFNAKVTIEKGLK